MATSAWTTAWSRRLSPKSFPGLGGPTRLPRSARSTACTWWCCCGPAPTGAVPVAYRLWRPKRSCAPAAYQTKLQLATRTLTEVRAAGLPVAYLVMDTHYTAGWLTRLAGRLGVQVVLERTCQFEGDKGHPGAP